MYARLLAAALVVVVFMPGCARMKERRQERREEQAKRQIERRMEAYRAVIRKLPDDPDTGVPLLEPFYEPDKLTPYVLRRDYRLVRQVSENIIASSIYKLKLSETGNYAVATIRYVRKQHGGGETFGGFDSEWKRIRGRWFLALDNFWSDSSVDINGDFSGIIHSSVFPPSGLEELPFADPPGPGQSGQGISISAPDRRFESYPVIEFGGDNAPEK